MGGITISTGKTEVHRQAALYKIEEDTPDRLVIRAKKIGAIGGGIILLFMGLVMSWGTYAVAEKEKSVGAAIIAGIIALLLLAGGIALLRLGIRNKDRIIFDRHAGEVRFEKTRQKDSYSIPFADIEKFKLRFENKSFSSREVNVVFKFVIITKVGDEIKVDEAFKPAEMKELAAKAANICGVPFDESAA
jgi:hypothetical protein